MRWFLEVLITIPAVCLMYCFAQKETRRGRKSLRHKVGNSWIRPIIIAVYLTQRIETVRQLDSVHETALSESRPK